METAVEDPQKDGAENAPSENASVEKATPPPAPEPSKKSKREDRNKKNDNYVEQFMKAVNSASTVEDKVNVACQKFSHMVDDNKRMQFYIKQSEKRHMLLLKEKEQLQHEFNKTVLVKSKLENLCRELQKQNKAIKEESLHKIREEEERRKETQAKFQNTLSEITTLLQQNNEKNAKLRDDNISMTEKFKSVVQQYQLREQQVDKMAKQMALEQQLSDAKLQKASLEHQAEKERLLAEMEQLKVTVAQFRAKIVELQGTETGLRGQLAVYTDKYDEFQSALVKSNQVFGGFKEEMEKMSKKIKKLEKESLSWKKRWETSQTALLEMCGERQANDDKMAAATRQLAHMQSLCRTLQAERTVLLSTLKEHDIERPPLPTPPPAPAPAPAPPAPASNAKVDAMAANCAQLRQSLAHLQSQLNVLTNKQAEGQQQPPKPEKPKKSKSKKSKKQEPKESESDTKESASENEPNVLVDKEAVDVGDVKADEKTLDTIMQAINNANINLSDLEDGTDKIEDVLNTDPTKETATNDVTAFDDVAAAPDVTAANDVTAAADVTVANDVIAPSDVTNLVKDVTNLALSDVTEVPKENVQVIDNKEAIPLKNEVVPAIENEPKVKADKVEIAKTETKEEKEITNNEIKNVDAQVNGA